MVLSANAWMNQPGGFEMDAAGEVVSVNVWQVIFNDAVGYTFAHMYVATFICAGFLVASVYAVGMLRGRRDRYHRLGFLLPFTVAAIAMPIQMFVGDVVARAIYEDQPIKFAALELNTTTGSHKPEILLGHLNADGTVSGGIEIPEPRLLAQRPGPGRRHGGDRASTRCRRRTGRPRAATNIVHLAWDTMVGLGTALTLLALWFAVLWRRRRAEIVNSTWFLRAAAIAPIAAYLCLEAGWVVTEVGRQPWVVYEILRTAGRGHQRLGRPGVDLLHVDRRAVRRAGHRLRAGDPRP